MECHKAGLQKGSILCKDNKHHQIKDGYANTSDANVFFAEEESRNLQEEISIGQQQQDLFNAGQVNTDALAAMYQQAMTDGANFYAEQLKQQQQPTAAQKFALNCMGAVPVIQEIHTANPVDNQANQASKHPRQEEQNADSKRIKYAEPNDMQGFMEAIRRKAMGQ